MKPLKTIPAFRRHVEARYPGCQLRDDGCALHLEAPHRTRWDGDLHEFVAEYRRGFDWPKEPGLIAEAIADMTGRLEWAVAPQPCTGPCEWCDDDLTLAKQLLRGINGELKKHL